MPRRRLEPTWARCRNRLGETLSLGGDPESGFFWLGYHAGFVRARKPYCEQTPKERREFGEKLHPTRWKGHDPVVAALLRATVVERGVAPIRAAVDRLEGGEVPGFDPRSGSLRQRRHWSRVVELLRSSQYEDRLWVCPQ